MKRLISAQNHYLQMPHGLKNHTYIWEHFVLTNFLDSSLVELRDKRLQGL